MFYLSSKTSKKSSDMFVFVCLFQTLNRSKSVPCIKYTAGFFLEIIKQSFTYVLRAYSSSVN